MKRILTFLIQTLTSFCIFIAKKQTDSNFLDNFSKMEWKDLFYLNHSELFKDNENWSEFFIYFKLNTLRIVLFFISSNIHIISV